MTYQTVSALQMNHKPVVDTSGEKLGVIEDVVMAGPGGTFSHVIVRCGGILGLGAQRYALPFAAITISADGQCCRIDMSEQELSELPHVDGSDYSVLTVPLNRLAMQEWPTPAGAEHSMHAAKQR